MKKTLLLCGALIASTLIPQEAAAAYEQIAKVGDLWYGFTTVGKKHYAAVMPDGDFMYDLQGEITVPETVEFDDTDWTVNELYSQAFVYQYGVTKINLPETITTVGELAFAYCESLTEVNLPEGIESFGPAVFGACESLTSVTLPASMTSIPYNFFKDCKSLTSVTLPAAVTKLDQCAFDGCTSLADLNLHEGITMIDGLAFRECPFTSITLPASCDSIGVAAFAKCYNLTEVKLAPGSTAFSATDGILFSADGKKLVVYPSGKTETAYTIPDGVESVSAGAFYHNKNLSEVTLPATCLQLDTYAFAFSHNLAKINLNEGLDVIGGHAFYECNKLGQAHLPSTLRKVEEYAFQNAGLTSVVFPQNLEFIGKIAYYGCQKIENIAIPEGIAQLYINAFGKCTAMKTLTLPSTLTELGEFAFNDCKALETVTCNALTPPVITHGTCFSTSIFATCHLIVPEEAVEAYRDAPEWKEFNEIRTMGIDNPAIDTLREERALYYDLSGRPVANPSNGIYLRRTGNKVTKVNF